jgi:hypothetical protein
MKDIGEQSAENIYLEEPKMDEVVGGMEETQ